MVWKPEDHPLSDLPGRGGALVARRRREGRDDAAILEELIATARAAPEQWREVLDELDLRSRLRELYKINRRFKAAWDRSKARAQAFTASLEAELVAAESAAPLARQAAALPPNIDEMGIEKARQWLLEAAWEAHDRPAWRPKEAARAALELYGNQSALHEKTSDKLVQNAWRAVRKRPRP